MGHTPRPRGEPGAALKILRILLIVLVPAQAAPIVSKKHYPVPSVPHNEWDAFIHLTRALFSTWVKVFIDVFFRDVGRFAPFPCQGVGQLGLQAPRPGLELHSSLRVTL